MRWDVWSLCQNTFSNSYSTVLLQKYPTLHCQQHWLFWVVFIDWQKHGCCLNISTDLSHYLCLRVSYWVVPHWCATAQFTHEAVIHSLSLHKHSGWVCPSPSIHISCRWNPWILVCLVHIQSLLLARLLAKKIPFFPLLLLWVVVTQGPVPQILCYSNCSILCSSLVIVCFLWIWYIASLQGCISGRVFGCRFGLLVLQWWTWSDWTLF